MDNNILAKNVSGAFMAALNSIYKFGNDISPRGKATRELTGVSVSITHPTQRCILLPGRKDSIVAKCAEVLWVLAGRDDVAWLGKYLPRAIQFSDNGRTWRGAYGPRLRNWVGDTKCVDQLKYVVDCLTKDPLSRQAVISLWNPDIDTEPGKDIPCNNWIQFLLRDKRLHMIVAQRSSDVWWGFSGIDAFTWTVLQQLMAGWLNVEVGEYQHIIGSFHLYEDFYAKADKMLHNPDCSLDPYVEMNLLGVDCATFNSPGFECLDGDLRQTAFNLLSRLDYAKVDELAGLWRYSYQINNMLIRIMTQVLFIAKCKELDWETVCNLMDDMLPKNDIWVALLEWLSRDNPAILDGIGSVTPEVYHWVYEVMLGLQ